MTLGDLAGKTRLQRGQRAGLMGILQLSGYFQASNDEVKTMFAYMAVILLVISADNFLLHVRAEKAQEKEEDQ